MKAVGLDIGTTTICAQVVLCETGEVLETACLDNDTFLDAPRSWERIQDADRILAKAEALIGRLVLRHAPIGAIGLTGQMHGLLYLDPHGRAASPLFTWQDGRGDLLREDGRTYAETLSGITGHRVATGYGAVTHFYNCLNRLVPDNAAGVCTVLGYVAMRLAGRTTPILHVSDAAGLGLFDSKNARFDSEALERAGLVFHPFPPAVREGAVIGRTPDGIPVVVAPGDNQAGFIGAVRDMDHSLLVNVGTGSQISLLAANSVPHPARGSGMEARPLSGEDTLLVGAALCGGRAYQVLESFFRSVLDMAGLPSALPGSLYPAMDELAAAGGMPEDRLSVATQFSGTREDPAARGAIRNIGVGNFTARHLIDGVLEGMADELYRFYRKLELPPDQRPTILVGSGNGVRKNPALQRMLAEKFGMPLQLPVNEEEAAFGAALFAAVGTGFCGSIREAQSVIRYRE